MKLAVAFSFACASVTASAQRPPAPVIVDAPTVKVLTGLTVTELEAEMQLIQGDTRPKTQQ